MNLPSSTKSTVPSKGRLSAAKLLRHQLLLARLLSSVHRRLSYEHLIGEGRKASTTNQATNKIAVLATNAKSSKATTLEMA